MPEIKLNQKQQKAVDTIEGPVLVLAGPGTGKTQLLSSRVANILSLTDVNPGNILCLTYTEAGVSAMKQRLADTIGASGYQVSVHTFHSFALEVMRRFPDYFLDSRGFQPIDDLTGYQILEDILSNLPLNFKLAHRSFARENRISELTSKISELKKAGLKPQDSKDLAKKNKADLEDLNDLLSLVPLEMPRAKAKASELIQSLVDYLQTKQLDLEVEELVPSLKSIILKELTSAVTESFETSKTTPITAFKNSHLEKDSNNNWRFKDTKYNQNLEEVAHIYEQYEQALQQFEKIEFDDMVLNSINTVKDNEDLKLNIQEQWQYTLVDEFQDTSFSQLEIVKLLGDNPTNFSRPNIMVVGDDDQAIYAFQGASVSNFQSFLSLYPETEIITLDENYRSNSDILSASLKTSQQIEERPAGTDVKELNSNSSSEDREVSIVTFTDSGSELSWVCKDIKKQIEAGTKAEDIAILAPKHKYLQELANELNANQIPVFYETSSNILEDEIILELVDLSKLVLNIGSGELSHSNSLLAGVLSAPYWQLENGSIYRLASYAAKSEERKHWLDYLGDGALGERGQQIYSQLINWGTQSLNLSLEQMLDKLIGANQPEEYENNQKNDIKSPFKDFYFSKEKLETKPAHYANFLSSLASLRDHLRNYYSDQSKSKLGDLIKYVELCQEHGGIRLARRGLHIKPSGVNLLTAYGSKGLEFDQVYLIHCQEDVWSESARSRTDTLKLTANFASHKDTSDDRTRLFYVAQTRAKDRLVHTLYKFDEKGKSKVALRYLEPLKSESFVKLTDYSEDLMSAEESAESYQQKLFNVEPKDETTQILAEILQPILEKYRLSATHLTTWLDEEYGGREEFIQRHLLRFPQAMSESAVHGSAMHKVFEKMHLASSDKKFLSLEDLIKIYRKEVVKCSLDEETKDKLNSLAEFTLNRHLTKLNDLTELEALSEVDIKVNFEDVRLSGKLDAVIINRNEQTAIIRDYKTGKSKDKIEEKYKNQLYLYKLLLDLAPERLPKDIKLKGAELVYINASDDEVKTLSLDYKESEYEEFKKLIKQVWQEIMHLGQL